MRAKVAIGLVVAFLATMLSVGPASAGVNVVVRNNGDILINGDGTDNHVHVVFCDEGVAIVVYGDLDEIEGYEIIDVVDDLTINLKGGNDNLSVTYGIPFFENGVAEIDLPEECLILAEDVQASNGGPDDIPGNLKILGASGNDDVDLFGLNVGKDVTVSLSSGDNHLNMEYMHVGDDVTVRASGGGDGVWMYGFWIDDRLDVNLSAGNNDFYFGDGSTARAIIRGHNGDDYIETGNCCEEDPEPVHFGHNPIMVTAGGSDHVDLDNFTWSGKLRLNTGSGDDGVYLDLDLDSLSGGAEDDASILDLDTAAGNDDVRIYGELIDGDDLNGGPGGSDVLRVQDLGGAVEKNFETFIDYSEAP